MNGSSRRRAAYLAAVAVVASLVPFLAAACGVGESEPPGFAYAGVGPEGGTVAAGEVTLVLPPGALAAPTSVSILPQGLPLPIDPGLDPCEIAFLGPIWCCGPVALGLAVPATLRVTYDEAQIPPGSDEDDLVLLLWDDPAQVLRPVTDGVVHDAAANAFETTSYVELGHLAVGVRLCAVDTDLYFLGVEDVIALVPQAAPPRTGLYHARADGTYGPVLLPTGGPPERFVPSPDRTRVLLGFLDSETESYLLSTLLVGDAAPVPVVDSTRDLVGGDPLFGWMRESGRVFFQEYFPPNPVQPPGAEPVDAEAVSTAAADGGGAPAVLHPLASLESVTDLRQSDDGSHLLLRVALLLQKGLERLDVVDASSGAPISVGVIPVGAGQHTPRFVPASDDVYGIDDAGTAVVRYAPDGTEVATLAALPPETGTFQDFVLAPDGERFACIVREPRVDGDFLFEVDVLAVGTLAGGVEGTTDLGATYSYGEVLWHPDGLRFFVDFSPGVTAFSAADASPLAALPIDGMDDLDVNVTDGRLLFVVGGGSVILSRTAGRILDDGLYVAEPDGSSAVPLGTLGLRVRAARWRAGIRATPGMFFVARVR